jgi:P-type E1-E2 ATPase
VRALGYDRIVSVGDGMNDVSMLETSDIGIAFGSVHAPVLSLIKIANYVTFSESGLCNILNML